MATDASTSDWGHPISAFARHIEAGLDDLAATQTWSMDDPEVRDTTLLLTRLEAQVAELSRRVLCEADRRNVAAETGGTNTANWLVHTTKLTRSEAHRRVRQA